MAEIKNLDFFKFNHFRKRDAEGNFEFGNLDNNYLDETNDEYLVGYKFEDDKAKEFKILITDLLSNVEPSDPSDPSDPTPTGKYVVDIAGPTISGTNDIYTVMYSDNSTKLITIAHGSSSSASQPGGINGEGTGDPGTDIPVNTGRSILNITGPISEGLVDTYTIHYTDNTTSTFTVTNGRDGSGGEGGSSVQSDWNQSDSEAADFVKNRTHYVESFNCDPWLDADVDEYNEEMGMCILNHSVPYPGCNIAKVTLTIDENEHVFFCQPEIYQDGSVIGIDFASNDYGVEMSIFNNVAVIGIGNENGQVTGHVKIELYDYLYITENGESVAYPSNFAFGSVGEAMDDAGMLTIPLPILENYNDGDMITVKLNAGTNIETYTSRCKHVNVANMPFICIGNPWVYLPLAMGGGEIQSVADIPEEYKLMYGSTLGPDTGEDWCMLSSNIEGGTVFMKMNTTYQNENVQYFSVARSTVNVYKKLDIPYMQIDWNTDGNDNHSAIINKPCYVEHVTYESNGHDNLNHFAFDRNMDNVQFEKNSDGDYEVTLQITDHYRYTTFPIDRVYPYFELQLSHDGNFSRYFYGTIEYNAEEFAWTLDGRAHNGSDQIVLRGVITPSYCTIVLSDIVGNVIADSSQTCSVSNVNFYGYCALLNDDVAALLATDNVDNCIQHFTMSDGVTPVYMYVNTGDFSMLDNNCGIYLHANNNAIQLSPVLQKINVFGRDALCAGNIELYNIVNDVIPLTGYNNEADADYFLMCLPSEGTFVFLSTAPITNDVAVGSYKDYFLFHKLDSRYLPNTPSSSSSSSFSGDYNDLSNKPNLATVATTGDYNDLTNTPAIPTVPPNVSAFTNDAGYITTQDIPTIPTVPTNVSAFTNDAGYLKTLVGDAVIPNAVTDYDGNTYSAVILGDQVWMAQNLRTTHYADGTYIGTQAHNEPTPLYYTIPNVDLTTYGLLYPWDAVMNGASSSDTNPSEVQGIAPTAWHVPSDAEWTVMKEYVSSHSEYQCGGFDNIAKALSSETGWKTNSNPCAVGNNQNSNNASGFSAIPAGICNDSSLNNNVGYTADFWSSTQGSGNTSNAISYHLNHDGVAIFRGFHTKTMRQSIRCLYNGTVEEFLKQWLLANRNYNYYLRPKVNGFEFVLPPAFNVTAADAGKILMVDANGEYTPITLSELKTQLDALT